MNMYGSNSYKRDGISQQPFIAKKIQKLFESQGYVVSMIQATAFQDMKEKFDYLVIFDKTTPFELKTGEIIESIKIDVKYAKSFTLYDQNGENTLKHSKSTFIVYNFPDNPSELLFINTDKFRECLSLHEPNLRMSEESGNKSKYFFIEQYLRENQNYMGNFVNLYTI